MFKFGNVFNVGQITHFKLQFIQNIVFISFLSLYFDLFFFLLNRPKCFLFVLLVTLIIKTLDTFLPSFE